MPLAGKGLVKLMEECGELTQIAAKKLTFPDTDEHPDGQGSMHVRMEEEIADVLAAIYHVVAEYGLDTKFIDQRRKRKLELFRKWSTE